jgi:glycosyltransferase involved in cell wall biosynthesis
MIDIIIPTIRSEDKLPRVLLSLALNSSVPHIIHIVRDGSSYAEAINLTYPNLTQPFFFMGSDDLYFHKDWDIEALKCMTEGVDVVGTNDLHNQEVLEGKHSTHSLVRKSYIDNIGGVFDKSFPILYNYKHNYCDSEFIETAKKREVFKPCLSSKVEHLHHIWGLSPNDEVYQKGANANNEDLLTFNQRKSLI